MGGTTHGATRGRREPPEYRAWKHLRQRCLNPNTKDFPRYGGRGISICRRWLDGDSEQTGFECFLADMGPRPTPRHSIDRIDGNGDYEPANCRWATAKVQANNSARNRIVSYLGRRLTLVRACALARLNYRMVRQRLSRGWDVQRALSTPATRRHPGGKILKEIESMGDLVDPLASVRNYLAAEKSAATRRSYATAWRKFTDWCEALGNRDTMPADALVVAQYLAHLADKGRRPPTIVLAAAAIGWAHRSNGHPSPSDHEGVKAVMRGIRREICHSACNIDPLSRGIGVQN